MVNASQISWGTYKEYEGPKFGGVLAYEPPTLPDFWDKCLAVVVATEGGHYDSLNMYDSCVLSTGLIQCCEGLFLTSKMLGSCPRDEVSSWLSKLPTPAVVKRNNSGQLRFHFADGREAGTKPAMKDLFFGGSSGLTGEWSDSQKAHARQVAAVFASMWGSYSMRKAQVEFVKPILPTFMRPTTTSILSARSIQDSWWGAIRALVLSFSVNLPVVADKFFIQATQSAKWAGASDEVKFYMVAKSLAFGPNIGLWRARYRDLQPTLKSLFQVNIPTLPEVAAYSGDGVPVPKYREDAIDEVIEVQRFLASKGYDVGTPDGIMGKKTKAAIMEFQSASGLIPDGAVGPMTRAAMLRCMNGE